MGAKVLQEIKAKHPNSFIFSLCLREEALISTPTVDSMDHRDCALEARSSLSRHTDTICQENKLLFLRPDLTFCTWDSS